MCARGSGLRAARGTREGLGGLRRRETGRALEAGLREDYRQLGTLQGVDEGVDGPRAGSSTGPGAPAAAGSRSSTRARPRSPSTCASPASGRAGLGPCGILNLASPRADWSISTGRETSARGASSTSGDASMTTAPSSSAGRAANTPAAWRSPGARTATYASTPKRSRTGTGSSLTGVAATF